VRALVIGGGIGGLTAAIALRRAGIDAAVFERAPELRQVQVGFGIHLWHNGMKALQSIGVGEQVREVGGEGAVLQRAEFCDRNGRLLGSWSDAAVTATVGAPTVGISRGELHTVLVEALDHGVELAATCTGFVADADGVTARFADGREERGDVLVGADGLNSVIRKQLLGEQPPRFAGYSTWQAFVDFEDERTPIGLFRTLWGPSVRFLFYRVSSTRLYWMVQIVAQPDEPFPEDKKAFLRERLSGWAEPIDALIEATSPDAITRMDVYDRPPAKHWGTGRTTLLGDAAHPMTNNVGQGANQAIEDAVALAKALSSSPQDPAAALRSYEQSRIPRTTKFTRLSSMLGSMSRWHNPVLCAVRNRFIAFSFSRPMMKKQIQDWSYEA
jgi:2-polyprenyl-6-methoxyphenol hydroxylase-like FAD-dependent oxidoreductase